MDIVPSISTLATMAAAAEAEDVDQSNETPELRAARIQKKQYIRTLHKVVDQSDIVIMVLDARDPEGCRSRMVEDEVRRREADGKRLIFVLNKIGESTSFKLTIDFIQSTPRPCSQGECTELAQVLKTYSPDPTIPVFYSTATTKSVLANFTATSQSAEELQTPK